MPVGAGLGSVMTLRELAASHGLEHNAIVEILNKSTPLIEDMAFQNGNQLYGHMFRVRAGLPGVTFRAINKGVKPTRSSVKVQTETCAMMEAVSEIDKKLVDMADDQALFRLQESAAFIEEMGQRFEREVWYGDTGWDPQGIMGLSKRYSDLTGPAADYILDCGGTGNDNTSIWLIVHSTESFFGIVPKNSKAGLQHFASGVIDLNEYDDDGKALGTFQGYRDRFQWDIGICLKDYRQVVRACNISINALFTETTTTTIANDLLLTVNRMTNRIYNLNAGRPVFYMSRTLKDFWERQLLTNTYIERSIDQATGKLTTSYKGIPIHLCDMLLDTEERVI